MSGIELEDVRTRLRSHSSDDSDLEVGVLPPANSSSSSASLNETNLSPSELSRRSAPFHSLGAEPLHDPHPSPSHAPVLIGTPPLRHHSQNNPSHGSTTGSKPRTPTQRAIAFCLTACFIILMVIILAAIISRSSDRNNSNASSSSSSSSSPTDPTAPVYASMEECLRANRPIDFASGSPDAQTFIPPSPSIYLLKSVTLHSGLIGTQPVPNSDILVNNGKIQDIAYNGRITSYPATTQIIDLTGYHVTPGLVDLHSHAGVGAFPTDLTANDDVNEMTNPTFPQLRAIDALNPNDPALKAILRGGVTTSQVMPGSGDTMGGQGVLIKHRFRLSSTSSSYPSVSDLLIPNAPRLLKMACGENPKRVFGGKGVTPMSRLGSAWVMREKFEAADKLKTAQDKWCSKPSSTTPFPNDRALESLNALLRGEARLNTHCYQTQDFEMMLRLSHEFGFNITTFHHALDAFKRPDLFKPPHSLANINIATFADLGLYKQEAYDASTQAPRILDAAGINVILKTDHPVTFAARLMSEAAKAHHYGLPADRALAAVTSRPAMAAGLGDRLGSIALGLDADLVAWDRHPLRLGATPAQIFVNGEVMLDDKTSVKPKPDVAPNTNGNISVAYTGAPICGLYDPSSVDNPPAITSVGCYLVQNVDIYTPTLLPKASILVQNGTITCVAGTCPTPAGCALLTQAGGVITPGLVESNAHIGQMAIDQEDATQDGVAGGTFSDGSSLVIQAIDGIAPSSRQTRGAWIGGVTSTISRPQGYGLVKGISVWHRTCCNSVLSDDMLISSAAAIHITVGNDAKSGGITQSISGQFAALRSMFRQAQSVNVTDVTATNAQSVLHLFALALKGVLPVAMETHSADVINSAIRLQKLFGFRLIILGGAEAHLVASQLATTSPLASVVLQARPFGELWSNKRTVWNSYMILKDYGIPFAISTSDTDNARNLRWEAGYLLEAGLSTEEAIRAVSTNIKTIFQLGTPTSEVGSIAVGQKANFVLYNGAPFSFQTTIQLIVNGMQVDCQPRQR